jgi:4-aminobutyrate aminotransferase
VNITDDLAARPRDWRPSQTLRERARSVFPPAAARHTDLGIVRAKGAVLYTDDGQEILDLACGVAVTNVGHNHPRVVASAHTQIDTLLHAGHNIGVYPTYVELAERLIEQVAFDAKVFFANSGAEALEAGVKLAMHVTGRTTLVAFKHGFHGRTLATTALSASAASYRARYGAALPHVHHVDFPNAFARASSEREETTRCLAELDDLFRLVVPTEDVAAIVVEPFQGEGGYVPAPTEFLRGLRERADVYGIALVFDEVQSAFGRTGKMFAYEHSGVEPDVLALAKGIANGLPLGAIVARAAMMDRWPAGAHGGTFGGNPVACAAALSVLDVLTEGALQNACEVGARLKAGLEHIADLLPLPSEVRGTGVMLALELRHHDGTPATEVITRARQLALEKGVLVLSCGVDKNVLRLMPPTTLTSAEADIAIDSLQAALTAAAG